MSYRERVELAIELLAGIEEIDQNMPIKFFESVDILIYELRRLQQLRIAAKFLATTISNLGGHQGDLAQDWLDTLEEVESKLNIT